MTVKNDFSRLIQSFNFTCLFVCLFVFNNGHSFYCSFVKIQERLTRNRRLQQVIQQGREAGNRRKAAMENPDGHGDARLEDVYDEGGEAIQPIGEADLPVHVVVEAEINITHLRNFDVKSGENIAMHSSDEDLLTDERASGVQQMFMASEAGPAATQGVEIELKRRKVAIHCSNEVSE